MRLVRRLVPLTLVLVAAGELSAQIPKRRGDPNAGASSGIRLLVANPHTFAPADSAASIQIGDALRTRLDKITGNSFAVITRAQMNEAMVTYGYSRDPILNPLSQRTLASSLQAKAMVGGSMTKDASGRYTVTARFAGLNDDAGAVMTAAQASGQSLADLGINLGDKFAPVFKSYSDAKACVDQMAAAPAKAIQSAEKALNAMPKNGLAHYCIGVLSLAKGRKADTTEAVKHLQEAVAGDPQSLPAWTQLAALYEAAGDTTRTVEALQQMLVVAPTNQPLREQAFRIFLKYGRPDAAEKAAEDGLRIDQTNADLWELLAGARVWRENYAGAIEAFEESVANDSARADTTFYGKVLTLATQKPDTPLVIKWAGAAVKKFPDNLTLMQQAIAGYAQIGLTDSLVSVTRRVLAIDTTATGPALQVAQQLQGGKKWKEAVPFIEFAVQHGDAATKENASGLLLNGVLQSDLQAQDFVASAQGLRRVVAVASPAGRYAPIANHYLALSLIQQIIPLDKTAEQQKSCEAARQMEQMINDAQSAITGAESYEAGRGDRVKYKQYLDGETPRVSSMIKVYCK